MADEKKNFLKARVKIPKSKNPQTEKEKELTVDELDTVSGGKIIGMGGIPNQTRIVQGQVTYMKVGCVKS